MKRQSALLGLLLVFFLAACARKDQVSTGNAPRVTVALRDGSSVGGTLVDNSPSKITVAGDDGITRTIPVAQVSSIAYGDGGAPSAAPSAQTAAANQAPAPQPSIAVSPSRKAPDRQPKASERQAAAIPPSSYAPPAAPPPPPDQSRVEPGGQIESHSHPAESAITTRTYEVPVGTTVSVRTEETIDSAKAVEGQTFAGEVTEDITDADGATVVPKGANAQLIIRSVSKGGKIRGASDLVLDLQEVAIDGREYEISTSDLAQQGKSGIGANKRTAIFTGGGAALGAIIGAIAGGGKGAAIGAGAGGGGGALTQILTKGSAIRIPVETVLKFQLDKPLHVTAAQ